MAACLHFQPSDSSWGGRQTVTRMKVPRTKNRQAIAGKRRPGDDDLCRDEQVGGIRTNRSTAIRTAAGFAGATAAGGVSVDRGQDAQQGRTAASTRRLPVPTDPGDGARPLEAGMQWRRVLDIRRTHRTEAPENPLIGRPRSRTSLPALHPASSRPGVVILQIAARSLIDLCGD